MGLDQPILNASGANFDPSYRVKLTILILRRVLQQYVKYCSSFLNYVLWQPNQQTFVPFYMYQMSNSHHKNMDH